MLVDQHEQRAVLETVEAAGFVERVGIDDAGVARAFEAGVEAGFVMEMRRASSSSAASKS